MPYETLKNILCNIMEYPMEYVMGILWNNLWHPMEFPMEYPVEYPVEYPLEYLMECPMEPCGYPMKSYGGISHGICCSEPYEYHLQSYRISYGIPYVNLWSIPLEYPHGIL